jgi:hypothetical protein
MRDIYSKAIFTNVWLGLASDRSDRAMDFVSAITDLKNPAVKPHPNFINGPSIVYPHHFKPAFGGG